MNMYAERAEKTASEKDKTGIPGRMKTGFERSSGFSFDDVRVYYNSEKPAQLRAHAYTQGNEVYIAPGQEKHLPHELGHVVQQKSNMVKPTGEIGGLPLNDDAVMENGADKIAENVGNAEELGDAPVQAKFKGDGVVQREGWMEIANTITGLVSGAANALSTFSGAGISIDDHLYEKKHRNIKEVEKYADAAYDAYEELLVVSLPKKKSIGGRSSANVELPPEAQQLKTKIERNYLTAIHKAIACGEKIDPDKLEIEKIKDMDVKYAIVRAEKAYKASLSFGSQKTSSSTAKKMG